MPSRIQRKSCRRPKKHLVSHSMPSKTKSTPTLPVNQHGSPPHIKHAATPQSTTSPIPDSASIPDFGTILPEGLYPLMEHIYKDYLNLADKTIILHDSSLNETCSEFVQTEFTLMTHIHQWVNKIVLPRLRPNIRKHWRLQLSTLAYFMSRGTSSLIVSTPSKLKTQVTEYLFSEEVWHQHAHGRGLKPDLVLRMFEIAHGVLEGLRGDQQNMIEWRCQRKADGWDDARIERADKEEELEDMIEHGLLPPQTPKRGRPLRRGPKGVRVFGKEKDGHGNPTDPLFSVKPRFGSEDELGKLLVSFSKMLKHKKAEFMSRYWRQLIHVYTGWSPDDIIDHLG
ncbi:hypothetical protein B7494_g6598 [Chlorociboria aeruginascens]|nr:hypothetical protein B7494_g6598 [Chlorociboria aeruginascens]